MCVKQELQALQVSTERHRGMLRADIATAIINDQIDLRSRGRGAAQRPGSNVSRDHLRLAHAEPDDAGGRPGQGFP